MINKKKSAKDALNDHLKEKENLSMSSSDKKQQELTDFLNKYNLSIKRRK